MANGSKKSGLPLQDKQYLSPEEIYSLNRALYQIKEKLGIDENGGQVWLVPHIFNKRIRSFHFACVLDDGWNLSGALQGRVRDLIQKLQNDNGLKQSFENAYGNLLKGRMYEKAVATVKEYIGNGQRQVSKELLSAFHLLYFSIRTHRALYLPGILYRGLEKHSNAARLEYFSGVPRDKDALGWPKYDGTYIRRNKPVIGKIVREKVTGCSQSVAYHDAVEHISLAPARGMDFLLELADLFYLKGELKAIMSTVPVFVLPIYDIWVNGEGYGGIWGTLLCTVESQKADEFEQSTLPKLIRHCGVLADELFTAGLATVTDESIEPPYDLVEHFVKSLVHIQDWERVRVHRKGKTDDEPPLYCYRHELTDGNLSNDYDWKRCEPNDCNACRGQGTARELKWKCSEIFSPELIPELSDEEVWACNDYELVFEYPETAYVPTSQSDGEEVPSLFEHAIKRQQIEALRFLVPKARARRYALRTAATSIMSRNMSHNIGSHVLSAVGAEDTLSENKVKSLLRYLQERMDFLAEAATTTSYLELPAYLEKDVIEPFNDNSLLVNNISGTGVKAEIEVVDDPNKIAFGCPGGRLGFHAVYIILENMIRNTAKHAGTVEEVTLKIKVTGFHDDDQNDGDQRSCPELVRVRVWDCAENGRKTVEVGKTKTSLFKYVNQQIKRPMIDASGRLDPHSWGIREMLVAASYLRNIPLEDLEGHRRHLSDACGHGHRKDPEVLKALVVNDDGEPIINGDGNLCYEFYLRRPRIALIIGQFDNLDEQVLRQQGIELVPDADAIAGKRIEHQYLVYQRGCEPRVEDEPLLPVRRMIMDDDFPSRELSDVLRMQDGKLVWKILAESWKRVVEVKHLEGNGANATLYSGSYKGVTDIDADALKNGDGSLLRDAIWFDRHAEAMDEENGYYLGVERVKQLMFWEPYRKEYDQSSLYEGPPAGTEEALAAEFLAAGMSRIIIIDERVQKGVAQGQYNIGAPNLERKFVTERRRIYVPDREACDLHGEPSMDCITKFLESIDGKVDFLVVHQGILERLGDGSMNEIRHYADKQEADVVVCSGRGIPTGLNEGVRFVPLSSLERWAVQAPSKYHLYQLLCASRSPMERRSAANG